MKVALLGAPGSGKTKLARKLTQCLNTESDPWKLIDGYVDRWAKRTGNPRGPVSDLRAYKFNLQIIAERWTLEEEASVKGYSTITCGSIFETLIYAAAQSVALPHLTEDALLLETHVARDMMGSLGLLSTLFYDYAALFYLPLASDKLGPWDQVVDAKLDEVLTGQNKEAIVLDGTNQQRAQKAESTIKALQKARRVLERGVRGSRALSEGDAPRHERVPDVPAEDDRDRTG